jgi:proteasome lid subunit RPN8/RPN11
MVQINTSYWRITIDPAELGSGNTWDELQGNTIRYTVRVSDNAGNMGISAERTEYIDPRNDLPYITNDDVKTATEETEYSETYNAVDDDKDTLTWSLDSNATWLSLNPSTGVLSGTPPKYSAGTYYVNITVSDGNGGTDWQRFIITVTFNNKDPIISGNNLLTIEAKTQYNVDYDATDDRTPVANLVWSLETNATWLSIDPNTGILSGTPQESDIGSYWVKIRVGDGEGGFESRNFTITVTKPPNNRPELNNGKMEPSSGDTDTEFTFSVVYTDEDNDPGEVYVWVDGDRKTMQPDSTDNDFTDGVLYTFETKLVEGTHTYYFTATDGKEDAVAGDNTPVTEATAANTPEIEEAKKTEDNLIMYLGIAIVIIIIILLLAFMFFRSRGGEVEAEEEGVSGKPRIVGPVDDEELGLEDDEAELGEEDEYPYEDVSKPFGDEEGLEVAEMPEEVEALKPEISTLELEDQMEVIELGLVMPCSVCQGIMSTGEKAFQCTCGLVSHTGCVSGLNVCPQCGKEITIPELAKPKVTKKLPLIRAETKREVQEQTPPTKAYFTFVPGKNTDKELSEYIGGYYKNKDFGPVVEDDDLRYVRLFITPESAKIMLDHCYKQGRVKEVMGLMIGETFHYKNDVFSIVKDVVTSDLDATEVNVKFDSFEKLFDQLDKLDYDYQIIGWYHSHPNYSSFMSPTDADTQQRMFKHPYQYAIVIDPIRYDMNAFTLDQTKKSKVKEKPFSIVDLEE